MLNWVKTTASGLSVLPAGAEGTAGTEPQDQPHWKLPWGDRRTELVVIGQDMDHAAMEEAFELCLMTDDEMAHYADIFCNATPPWANKAQATDGKWPDPGPEPTDTLTYNVGDQVQCNCGDWMPGKVVKHWYRDGDWVMGKYAPYQVELDNGGLIFVPRDKATFIKPLA